MFSEKIWWNKNFDNLIFKYKKFSVIPLLLYNLCMSQKTFQELYSNKNKQDISSILSIKKIDNSNNFIDNNWNIIILKNNKSYYSLIIDCNNSKKWYVDFDKEDNNNCDKVNKNDFMYLQEKFDNNKHKIKEIIYVDNISEIEKYTESLVHNIDNISVMLLDLNINLFNNISSNNSLYNINQVLSVIEKNNCNNVILIIDKKNNKWKLFNLSDDYKKDIDQLNNDINNIIDDIKNINLDSLKTSEYKFETSEEELLAKVYYYIVNNF